MSASYDFDAPERMVVATIGPVGQRVFLLQARQDRRLLTLKLEKQQVAALAQHLGAILQPAPRPGHLPDPLELEQPSDPDWVVGTLSLSYDEDADRLLLVAEELEREGSEGGALARFTLTREQAAALAIQGRRLVEAGRPPCPLCGYPLDPSGHACPKTNGNRVPTL